MNRTIIFLGLFLVLGGVTAWYLLTGEGDKTTRLAAERDFAVKDTDRIFRIFIADRFGVKTTLERGEKGWIYNGQYRASQNVMENLLDAIRNIQMKYKPPRAAVQNMVQSLASEGLKVELFDRKGKRIKAYYIGGSTADERGTFAIIDGFEQPYVTHLQGWEGNLRHRFSLVGDDWRDKTIFEAEVEDIRSVSVEYPRQRSKSFLLQREGEEWRVSPFYETTPALDRPLRAGVFEQYLSGFNHLAAESFANQNPNRDSITRYAPFCTIVLTPMQGAPRSVRLYPRYSGVDTDPKTGQALGEVQVERYYALVDDQDFAIVQNQLFKKIFWAYEFFFADPS